MAANQAAPRRRRVHLRANKVNQTIVVRNRSATERIANLTAVLQNAIQTMEAQEPQETTLDQTNYDSNDFDAATSDDEAAAMESGVDLDDDE